jgi:hypothetical protein
MIASLVYQRIIKIKNRHLREALYVAGRTVWRSSAFILRFIVASKIFRKRKNSFLAFFQKNIAFVFYATRLRNVKFFGVLFPLEALRYMRLGETRGWKQHYIKNILDLLVKTPPPKAYLLTHSPFFHDASRILAAFGERDFLHKIAPLILQQRDFHLSAAAAFVGLGDGDKARQSLLQWREGNPAPPDGGSIQAILPVRPLFPSHWPKAENGAVEHFPLPRVAGAPSARMCRVPVPDRAVAIEENAQVIGNFTVLGSDDACCVYDWAATPALPYVAGESAYLKGTSLDMDRAVTLYEWAGEQEHDEALHLAGRCAVNYFHWIIEYLPRLLLAEDFGVPAGIPALVPEGMPRQMQEVGEIANGGRFRLIEKPFDVRASVKRLYIPSMPTCIVDGRALPFPMIGGMDRSLFRRYRRRILDHVAGRSGLDLPKRVHLTRNAKHRQLDNESEIIAALEKRGFVAIDPVTLSFSDQVRLFRDAEAITGAGGAAFTNLLFCESQPFVAMSVAAHNVDFPLFANLLDIAGGRFSHVPGRPLVDPMGCINEDQYVHVDYATSAKAFIDTLDRMGYAFGR